MSTRCKKFYSWLLIMVMTISATGGAIAMDFGQYKHVEECRMKQPSLSGIDSVVAESNCPINLDEDSHIAIKCHTPCKIYSPPPQLVQFTTQYIFQQEIPINDDFMLSHYPDLLKRPPKTCLSAHLISSGQFDH